MAISVAAPLLAWAVGFGASAAGSTAAPIQGEERGGFCGNLEEDGGRCADWGVIYQSELQRLFDHLIETTGYNSFFNSLFRGKAELKYHADRQLIDGSPAEAWPPKTGPNQEGHPVIDVGYAFFDIARTEDEAAFILAHETGHLILEHIPKKKKFIHDLYSKWRDNHPEYDGLSGEARMSRFKADHQAELDEAQKCVENQADAFGKRLMVKAGYDPNAAGSMFRHAADWESALGGINYEDKHHDGLEARGAAIDDVGPVQAEGPDCFALPP